MQSPKRLLGILLAVILAVFPMAAGMADEVHASVAFLFGDPTGDRDINASDALLALQHSVQIIILTDDSLKAEDVDERFGVDASDALLMLQYSVGLIQTFPIEGVKGSVRLNPTASYVAETETETFFYSADNAYRIVQGGYFDGEKFFIAMTCFIDGKEITRIHVMDKEGYVIDLSEPLELSHANSITYNPKIDKLVIAHCQAKTQEEYYRYSLVDPHTLTITYTEDKEFPFFSMAYCPALDRYASARWGGETIDVCDGEMNLLHTYSVEQPKTLSQGVCADEDYICFVRSSQNGYSAEIRVYDWNGDLVHLIPLDVPDAIEPESINIVNGVFYIACNYPGMADGVIYSLKLVK